MIRLLVNALNIWLVYMMLMVTATCLIHKTIQRDCSHIWRDVLNQDQGDRALLMIRPLSIQSDPFKGSPTSHFQSATCTLCRHHQELLASGISTLDQPRIAVSMLPLLLSTQLELVTVLDYS